jgi:CubicO group peptidase (beta-lactamase class C family)
MKKEQRHKIKGAIARIIGELGYVAGKVLIIAAVASLSYSPATGHGAVDEIWPGASWERARPGQVGLDRSMLEKARDYALTGGGSGCITRHGRLVMQWGDQKRRYDLKSSTKAIGVTALGLALKDGKIRSLQDRAKTYHPGLGVPPESNAGTGWLDKITLFHLATQSAGFDKTSIRSCLIASSIPLASVKRI